MTIRRIRLFSCFLLITFLVIAPQVGAAEKSSESFGSPFGIHFDWIVNKNQLKQVPAIAEKIKELKVRNILIFLPWTLVEPSKGNYDWSIPDEIIRNLDGYEADILVRISTISNWGTPKSKRRAYGKYNAPNLPVQMDAYKAFLQQTVKRYGNKVKYWQIGNEVYGLGQFWAGTPEDYLSLLKVTHETIKRVDSTAKIIPAGIALGTINIEQVAQNRVSSRIQSALDFIDLVLSEGKDYFDLLDIHLYYTYESIEKRVKYVTDRMSKFGYRKPVISTEIGGPDIRAFISMQEFNELTRISPQNARSRNEKIQKIIERKPSAKVILLDEYREQLNRLVAEEVIRRYVACINSGVQKVFWLILSSRGGPDPLWDKMALVDKRGRPNAGYFALKMLADKVGRFESIEKVKMGSHSNAYLINKTGSKVYVLWSDRDEEVVLETKWEGVKITDGLGNIRESEATEGKIRLHLNSMPVFVESRP